MIEPRDRQHSVVHLDHVTRVALMVTPENHGDSIEQTWDAISSIRSILDRQSVPMTLTKQTVFVRSSEDVASIRRLMEAYYRERMPATSFITQPPCGGQALAIEAWALGGEGISVEFLLPDVVTVSYDNLRWIYVAGITSPETASNAYSESQHAFGQLGASLSAAGATFNDVSRIWLYQGGITAQEQSSSGGTIERYRELNRARADFFEELESNGQISTSRQGHKFYPASTGIGMTGRGLSVSCLGLQTDRSDVTLHPLENPRQTSAFDYAQSFSAKSPLFSRAMAVRIGNRVTTWISGTASILNSESVHLGDLKKQTEQAVENVRNLISAENFQRHGLGGMGAELSDLAKIRVYVKRPEDYAQCKAICESQFGRVPAIYASADICRSELLVEIEGVAFSDVRSAS